jgi:hypothetical protein
MQDSLFFHNGYETAENNINSFYEEEKEAFLVDMGSYKTEATENYNSFGEEGFVSPYSIETTYTMTRGDEVCISLLQSDYANLGGAHPSTFIPELRLTRNPEKNLIFLISFLMNLLAEIL